MSTTHPQISAKRRTASGSGAARQLRRNGFVPAVIYGHSMQAEHLQVEEKAMRTILHHATSSNFVVDVSIDGEGGKAEKRLAIVQARQFDPISKQLLHVDFHGVSADEKVTAHVTLEFVGTPAGAKQGGLLDAVLHSVEVSAVPDALPEIIEVDVTNMKVGDVLHIGELKLPQGVTATGDAGAPVVAISEPRVQDASATAAAEPEVVSKKAGDED